MIKMKRFLTALAIMCVSLLFAGSVLATDYFWDGWTSDVIGASSKWSDGRNWGHLIVNFPGSNGCCCDRAIINNIDTCNGGSQICEFDDSDGDSTYPFESRCIVDLLVDSSANSLALTFRMTGDTLIVSSMTYFKGGADTELATLDIDGGHFSPNMLVLDSSINASEVLVDMATGTLLAVSMTIIKGTVDIHIDAGAVMCAGMLIMENGSSIVKTGSGLLHSS